MSRLFSVAVFILLSGCYPPIEETCADIAATQCEICTSWGRPDQSVRAYVCCRLCRNVDVSLRNQSSTLQDPKADIQVCSDALSDWTCDDALETAAQGRGATVDACSYFL
ncbi:MAG: hypothetical protein R3E66_10875 [bacterium]